jgi:prepilin-type processing-associated H-X9-DG protein
MDIANAKLKETLADPLNGVITQGTDWLKNSVFGGQGAGQAAATAERTSAEISATAATTTFSATIMTEALPALQMLASSAAQAAGGSVIGSVANYLFADGGIMTSMGPLQLRKYANGGVANSPQVAIYGEAGPEAYVPLPDGRTIPVTINGSGMGAGNVQVNVINQTSTSVTAQQGAPRFDGKQMILDVVLTAATSPGSFRSGLKEAMK